MGLTSAMYTGLTGLNAHQARIDTIGNNIANVNTHAFKSSRTMFQTQYSQILSQGNSPNPTSGGVNPTQYGLGVAVGSTQRNHNQGSIETTGLPSDVAIEGNGFFILEQPSGRQVYTRDGSFLLDANNMLVSQDGNRVRGFGVDDNFNLVPAVLSDMQVPVGTLTMAQQTRAVALDGDLSAAGAIATAGSIHTSQDFVTGGGAPATAATALSDLRSATSPTVALFAADDTLTINDIGKGSRTLPDATFTVGVDGTTLGDLADWLNDQLSIDQTAGVPGTPGVRIENGALLIESNAGAENGFTFGGGNLISSNAGTALPIQFSETQAAVGESVFTPFVVYDSLGTPVTVMATFALESTPDTGPVWRYYLEQQETGQPPISLGTGTVSFDNEGNFVSTTGDTVSIDRAGTGAITPMTFALDFSGVHGLSTETSNVIGSQRDGSPPGTLTNFGIGVDGTIEGTFSNGLTRTLGQIAVATVPNEAGMVAEADNLFALGPNSGEPNVTTPGLFGSGTLLAGALELSNVDLSSEFIGLITTSAGFQASSRVISTSSDMLDQLLLILR